MAGPRKSVPVKHSSVILVSICVSLIIWLIPLLSGKYATVFYSYIPANEINKHLVSIEDMQTEDIKSEPKDEFCPQISSASHDGWLYNDELNSVPIQDNIQTGGIWKPSHCRARYAVTIVVGQRNRTKQLQKFIKHLHPFLAQQLIQYRLIVVEQDNQMPYNRGRIFNIGFEVANSLYSNSDPERHCFIFHDVDLLPLHLGNIYTCTSQPRHMTVAVDTLRYQLPYKSICGGAIAILSKQYKMIDGFSNLFEGWGGEDDDFCSRIRNKGLTLTRFDPSVSVYTMLLHKPSVPSDQRFEQLNSNKVSGLSTLHYKVTDKKLLPLMTYVKATW